MKPIEVIVTSNKWISGRKAAFSGLLLSIVIKSDQISLYTLISYLLPIVNLLISLILAYSCFFCWFLFSFAYCFCLGSLTFFNETLRSGFILLLLISYWSLIIIIWKVLATAELFINLIFLNIQAAFKISFF